ATNSRRDTVTLAAPVPVMARRSPGSTPPARRRRLRVRRVRRCAAGRGQRLPADQVEQPPEDPWGFGPGPDREYEREHLPPDLVSAHFGVRPEDPRDELHGPLEACPCEPCGGGPGGRHPSPAQIGRAHV